MRTVRMPRDYEAAGRLIADVLHTFTAEWGTDAVRLVGHALRRANGEQAFREVCGRVADAMEMREDEIDARESEGPGE